MDYKDLPPFDTSQYEPFGSRDNYVACDDGYDEIVDVLGAWPVPYVALPSVEHEGGWTAGMLHVTLPKHRPDLAPYYEWGGWAESEALPGAEYPEEDNA